MVMSSVLDSGNEQAAAEPVYSYFIEMIGAKGHSRRIGLTAYDDLIIGRSTKRCQIMLDDSRISRVHLRIRYHPDRGVTIADLFSANGSSLDGRTLRPGLSMTWLINQPVVIGRTHLILRYGVLEA